MVGDFMLKISKQMIFGYCIGVASTLCITAFATATILSKNISYSNPNTSATNVEDALNELYGKESSCDTDIGYTFDFGYTGTKQTFISNCTGYYKVELWGAQGGDYTTSVVGGKGAYTSGTLKLEKDNKLYIYIGIQGYKSTGLTSQLYAYNGGGSGGGTGTFYDGTYSTGGGATDIRIINKNWDDELSLKSRIMVASGGGGSGFYTNNIYGGSGGALTGISGTGAGAGTPHALAGGGMQTGAGLVSSSGYAGSFGFGGNTFINYGTGGGSGYYGGSGGGVSSLYVSAGAGGSSYISGYQGCVAISSATSLTPRNDANGTQCTESSAASDITCSYHYSGYVFTNANMIAGNASMPTHDGTSTMTGNSGNGYARITYLGTTLN